MRAIYIGILTDGTTSRMRADTLRSLLPAVDWVSIDTDEGFRSAGRLSRSVSFRFKKGPLVDEINRRIIKRTKDVNYDLAWVDKGIYLRPETAAHVRDRARRLVHFTPDTAFHDNRSRHFFKSAAHYDLLVTTKSFEMESYYRITDKARVMLTTQAYDAHLHRPPEQSVAKKPVVVFIGLCEPDRENCLAALLSADVPVRVGGRGWSRFIRRHASNPDLHYLGDEIFGTDYVEEYASASIGLGLLSKRFPEMHTTRTFEIPACGTLLATERTPDTEQFYSKHEALFFNGYDELACKTRELLNQPKAIEERSRKGYQRVMADGRDYASVLAAVLARLSLN